MWTSIIFLSLVFTQISGQGFQLFFGTTAAVTECKDKLPNCYAFGQDACKAPYEKWAHDYCPVSCGFCVGPTTPTPPCEDLKQDCEVYQQTVCTDDKYKQWAYDNCRYYCRLCTPEQLLMKDSMKTTLPPALCVDKLDDCKMYGHDSCQGQYASWAKENCRRFCGFCVGLPTPAPLCRDNIPNCNQYQKDTCSNEKYKGWAEENCNKYCGFCSDGSTSGSQLPTLSPVPTATPGTGNLVPQLPTGTLAPPMPGKRSLGAASSAAEGGNIFFEQPKPKVTPKPTPAPTDAPTEPPTTQPPTEPPTTTAQPTTPKPTTTEQPKPANNALSVGSSATGNKGENVIDFGNESELTTTEVPATTKKPETGSGTGSSAGGGTTAAPGTAATTQVPVVTTPKATNPPTQQPVITTEKVTDAPTKSVTEKVTDAPTKAPVVTDKGPTNPQSTQSPVVTTAASSGQTGVTGNGTESGTGSGPNNQSKKPGDSTTAAPSGTTASIVNVPTTASSGSGTTITGGSVTVKTNTSSGTGSGPQTGSRTTVKVPAVSETTTHGGPTKVHVTNDHSNSGPTHGPSKPMPATTANGPTQSPTTTPTATLMPSVNSVTLPDIDKADNYTDVNNTDTECGNLINCRVYPPEKICVNGSIYQPWAKVRCRAYCGFCIQNTSPQPCVDKIPNCNEYDADLCTNQLYRLFREDNCRKFCNLCSTTGRRDSENVDDSIEYY